MIVDCAHYRDGQRQHEGRMDLDEPRRSVSTATAGSCGSGMFEPDPAELREVQARFGLHDLAVEDAQSFHLRPKIEQYDDGGVYFAVLRTARYDDEREAVEFGEVSVFLSQRFVITVRQGVASDLHGARLRLERRPELLKEGPAAIMWAILDKVVDDYAPVLEGLEHDVEEVEATVFSGAAAPTERIYSLRREATDFYRAVHPLLGPLDALRARRVCQGQPRAVAVLPRRQRPPQARQRGGGRPARPAGDRPAGEHGGHLGRPDRDRASVRTRRPSS